MTREEQIQDAYDTYYDDTWDEHGGRAMVIDGYHDIWFPSCATNDFFKAGAEWADKYPQNPQLSAADRGIIDEIIFALNSLGEEKMISYHKEIGFLNKIRKL